MTIPISLVDDDNPPIYYLARITSVYCCNCRNTAQVTEPFSVHRVDGRTGINMRPLKYVTGVKCYNLPVKTERANPIPIPFCSDCASDETFKGNPAAPPPKVRTTPPSWVGANNPRDYTIAGTLKQGKEPKAAKGSKPKTYTLDDLD